VRDVELLARAGRAGGLLEEQLHLGVAHLDAVLHFPLAQAGKDDLLADVLAERVERHAVALQHLAEVGEGHLVLLGDPLHRPVELHLVDADPGVAGMLQLRLVEDQALEELALQHRALRRLRAAPRELALRRLHRLVQLRERDDFLVHHGDDAVDELHLLRGRRAGGEQEREEEGNQSLHV
jgi:hypothetical protein